MPSTPKQIHFIWLGSMLRNTERFSHQSRLIDWRLTNPEYIINLWYSTTALANNPTASVELQYFCKDNGIILKDIDSLTMKKHVCDFIVRCINSDTPNWAAISDIVRFYILRNGGWYFDTDIVLLNKQTNELAPLPDNSLLPFGFGLNLIIPPARFYYSPDMISTAKDSKFIAKCIEITENMLASPQINAIFQELHNKDPEKRRLATCYTTGEIAFAACLKLQNLQAQPFISFVLELPIEDRLYIPNLDSCAKISIHHIYNELNFLSLNERSYMSSGNSESTDYSIYEDNILALFYAAISYKKPKAWSDFLNFWSSEPTEVDSSINISSNINPK